MRQPVIRTKTEKETRLVKRKTMYKTAHSNELDLDHLSVPLNLFRSVVLATQGAIC